MPLRCSAQGSIAVGKCQCVYDTSAGAFPKGHANPTPFSAFPTMPLSISRKIALDAGDALAGHSLLLQSLSEVISHWFLWLMLQLTFCIGLRHCKWRRSSLSARQLWDAKGASMPEIRINVFPIRFDNGFKLTVANLTFQFFCVYYFIIMLVKISIFFSSKQAVSWD